MKKQIHGREQAASALHFIFFFLSIGCLFLPLRTIAQDTLRLLSFKTADGKYGFKDDGGRIVIPAKYENADGFREGLAAVKQEGHWGFIDKTGRQITPCKYEDVADYNEGLASVELHGKWGFIDKTVLTTLILQRILNRRNVTGELMAITSKHFVRA